MVAKSSVDRTNHKENHPAQLWPHRRNLRIVAAVLAAQQVAAAWEEVAAVEVAEL